MQTVKIISIKSNLKPLEPCEPEVEDMEMHPSIPLNQWLAKTAYNLIFTIIDKPK